MQRAARERTRRVVANRYVIRSRAGGARGPRTARGAPRPPRAPAARPGGWRRPIFRSTLPQISMSQISVLRRKFLQNFPTFTLFASLTPRGPSGLSHTCTSGHGSRERTYTIGTILQPTAARHEHVALPFDLLKPCRMRRVCHPRAQTRLIRLRGVEGIGVWGRGRRREISEIWVANTQISQNFLRCRGGANSDSNFEKYRPGPSNALVA